VSGRAWAREAKVKTFLGSRDHLEARRVQAGVNNRGKTKQRGKRILKRFQAVISPVARDFNETFRMAELGMTKPKGKETQTSGR